MILECLRSFAAHYFKKPSVKSKYLAERKIFLTTSKFLLAFGAKCIDILDYQIREVTSITEALIFLFGTALANFFLLVILTRHIIDKALSII